MLLPMFLITGGQRSGLISQYYAVIASVIANSSSAIRSVDQQSQDVPQGYLGVNANTSHKAPAVPG